MHSYGRKLGIALSTIAMALLIALVYTSGYRQWPKTYNGAMWCLIVIASIAACGRLLMAKYMHREPQGSPTGR